MFSLDWTVHFDSLLALVGVLVSVAVIWGGLRVDLRALNEKVAKIEDSLKRQTEILIEMGRQDQQLKEHDRRLAAVETLCHQRHWEGLQG